MNKFRKILLILTGISITACTSDKANDLTKYVDPFIGTGAPEFCDILLMPTTGKVNVLVGDEENSETEKLGIALNSRMIMNLHPQDIIKFY